ncbi:protein MARD1 [Iris pallida]|uniref:Protein MARD1 n=1 Tax=Iris pallida TaxID=29817 RepID=A0AAX6DY57_IRIPA|nr:protein MARD1 [Iris pallida]
MLKKRSRPVSSSSSAAKQSLMSDQYSLSSPKPLFPSPRVFVGFSPKGFADGADAIAMSPTSILETTKPFSPFFADRSPRKPALEPPHPVGLGIAEALKEPSRPESRMVLLGSQLKIQVPSSAPAAGAADCPQSPIEFGIKNKSSQLALHSPAAARRPPLGSSAVLVSGSLSATEMEMSEDYTCVIAHGPNPKTTHIFDNCIIESCCVGGGGKGFVPAAAPAKEKGFVSARYHWEDFLTSCHACKKSLGQGKDIFMYRLVLRVVNLLTSICTDEFDIESKKNVGCVVSDTYHHPI